MYYRDADVILLVYSVADKRTFTELDYWMDEVRQRAREDAMVIVVGNQCDRVLEETVSDEQGKSFAVRSEALFFKTSAKSKVGLIELLECIVNSRYPGFFTAYSEPAAKAVPEQKQVMQKYKPAPQPVPIVAPQTRVSFKLTSQPILEKRDNCC
eukprot:TRINITY_DN0_c878_g1_i3.p1 TRINITY_DN0_c878_g1~~TRINITY_DN0_c878_g1_i3.p1  ORF type:complete len:154 (+),score=30.75 TRINITY_DN0_c878_g1_i3:158-619(+)